MRRQLATLAALAAIAVPLTGCQQTVPADGATPSATSTATQEQGKPSGKPSQGQGSTGEASAPGQGTRTGSATGQPSAPSQDASESSASSSATSSTGDEAGATSTIRDVDFGNMTWPVFAEDNDLPEVVTLKDGRADVDGGDAFRNGRAMLSTKDAASAGTPFAKTTYADLDGDGDTDAIVGLHLDHGNGYSDYATVWLWENGKPRAIGNVASTGRCGDKATSIEVDSQGKITSSRQLRVDTDPCGGEQTGAEIADVYEVQDGLLELTQPGSVG